jgi:primosomal protein N''
MLLEDLPFAVQRTILRRDAEVRPILDAVSEIDLSWTIVQGNANELLETTSMWSGSHPKSRSLWTGATAKFHYHRLVVRRLHNFVSSATAHIAHLTRQSRHFRKFDIPLYSEFVARKKAFDTQLALLLEVRDYSEHGGPHHSVLILQGTTDGGLVGIVGLRLAAFVEDLKQKATRTPRAKLALTVISTLRKDSVDISTLVNKYYASITAHREWFRERLLALYGTLSNDLPHWAISEADWNAVVAWQDANPIPVYRHTERVEAERTP